MADVFGADLHWSNVWHLSAFSVVRPSVSHFRNSATNQRRASAMTARAPSRSEPWTRISRGPDAVKASSRESRASVSRPPYCSPADRRRPHTISASCSSATTLRTTAPSASTPGEYSSARRKLGQGPGDRLGVLGARHPETFRPSDTGASRVRT